MLSPELQQRLLKWLFAQGRVAAPGDAATVAPGGDEAQWQARWGPALTALLRDGRVSEDTLSQGYAALLGETAATAETLHQDQAAATDRAPVAASESSPSRTRQQPALLGLAATSPTDRSPVPADELSPSRTLRQPAMVALAATSPADGDTDRESASASAPAEPEPATGGAPVGWWERYELFGLLGSGGMGEVYKARDRRLNRLVALKFIRGGDGQQVLRFLFEARAQARIDHPNICKVFEAGEFQGQPFIAMQFVDGLRLDEAAARMTVPQKVDVMQKVALALHQAHALGIIHRDIKPSNILVEQSSDGQYFPVVMDFGIARTQGQGMQLTRAGDFLGTPAYVSPEQALGEHGLLDGRTDIYSLGATLYQLLAGTPPFDDTQLASLLQRVLHEEPPPLGKRAPAVAEDLAIIVHKCLEKEPAQRYPTARALAEDLARYLSGDPIWARRSSLGYRLRRRAQKHRTLVVAAALGLVCVLGAATFGVRGWLGARRARREAAILSQAAGQLGQEVKDIEWFLRTAYAQPLHDTEPEQALIRQRMTRLAARGRELGPLGSGLVHYALGRGHLALHALDEAARELDAAAHDGVDTPELHYARGRVLGALYARALEQARRGGNPAWLARREQQLEHDYLVPARAALEHSRGQDLVSPHYLEGLLAHYRRDDDAAAAAATRAAAETPWLVETHQLVADVASARAQRLLEHGDYEAARADFSAATDAYTRALDHARSDPALREAAAEVATQLVELDLRQGRPPAEAIERAGEAAEQAIVVAPRHAGGYIKKAFLLFRRYRAARRGDTTARQALLEAWWNTAARAVALDPRAALAREALGNAAINRGLYALGHAEDPLVWWTRAATELRAGIALQPDHPWVHNDLGLVAMLRGSVVEDRRGDPEADYQAAVLHFDRALSLDPGDVVACANLIDIHDRLAAWALEHDRDPSAHLGRAFAAGTRCVASDASYTPALEHLMEARLTEAEYRVATGAPAAPAVAEVLMLGERALQLNPAAGLRSRIYRGTGYYLRALDALAGGSDPRPALGDARNELRQASQAHGQAPCRMCLTLQTRLDLAAAAWARRTNQPSRGLLDQALAAARMAARLDPYPQAWLDQARACWRLGEIEPPAAAAALAAEGLAQIDQALTQKPFLSQGYALRGALLLLRARAARDPSAARTAAAEVAVALSKAFALNPRLTREYATTSAELQALPAAPH